MVRRTSTDSFERLKKIKEKINIVYGSLHDLGTIGRIMDEVCPDEVYNLAAQSDVGISFKCPGETLDIDYYGVGRIVNEAMRVNKNVRIYQASTSEMFGKTNPPQNENAPFQPVSPYGEAKLKAHEDFVVHYREKHELYVCSGFLFNHESPRRGENFVTRKITLAMSKIKLGLQDKLELGNLDAKRDWGFAGDYVELMWKMLQQDKPEDYVIATGESHSVRDFVNAAAVALDMKLTWEGVELEEVARDEAGKVVLSINKDFYRPVEVDYLLGDSSKAEKKLGWKPKTKFSDLVKMMVNSDVESLKN